MTNSGSGTVPSNRNCIVTLPSQNQIIKTSQQTIQTPRTSWPHILFSSSRLASHCCGDPLKPLANARKCVHRTKMRGRFHRNAPPKALRNVSNRTLPFQHVTIGERPTKEDVCATSLVAIAMDAVAATITVASDRHHVRPLPRRTHRVTTTIST